jgi:hypothetical protein
MTTAEPSSHDIAAMVPKGPCNPDLITLPGPLFCGLAVFNYPCTSEILAMYHLCFPRTLAAYSLRLDSRLECYRVLMPHYVRGHS